MSDRDATSGGGPLLELTGLRKDYVTPAETIPVLRGIDLCVHPGERLAIVGPSGSGKSTLLFILGLLLPATAGAYRMGALDVFGLDRRGQAEFRRRRVGFVFQSCNLIEHSTVWENLEYPLMYAGVERRLRGGLIREALEGVDLAHRLHHPANRLSGGEQQRVAVARALVNRPALVLADEPTGQLDRAHGQQVMEHLARGTSDGRTALVVVTHDPDVAAHCTRICRLEDGRLCA